MTLVRNVVLAALVSTIPLSSIPLSSSLAQTRTTADGTEWTDYVLPGQQQAGPPPTYPYQPLFNGAPGSSGFCPNGTLRQDGAWYRVCKCYGVDGCFVSYQSIGTYQCPPPDDTRYRVVTAIGRTKKQCGGKALSRTIEIYSGLGVGLPGDYLWNPGPLGRDEGDDKQFGQLDTPRDQTPDEQSKKTETATSQPAAGQPQTEQAKTEQPKTEQPKTETRTEERKAKPSSGATRSSGRTEKPRRKTARARIDRTTGAGVAAPPPVDPLALGVGVGLGLGLGMNRGGNYGDRNRW
jgi:hypothetical protein